MPSLHPKDLKFGHYYIADIAHAPNNPIHRCIVSDVRGYNPNGTILSIMRSGYEPQCMAVNTRSLAYFKIICEIEEMHPSKDCYRFIKDMPEIASGVSHNYKPGEPIQPWPPIPKSPRHSAESKKTKK